MAVTCGLLIWLAASACVRSNGPSEPRASSARDSAGTLAVENEKLAAIFSGKDGALVVYAKPRTASEDSIRIVPYSSEGRKADKIVSCKLVESGPERTLVQVSFSAGGKELKASFLFDEDGTIGIEPSEGLAGIFVSSAIEYGVLPTRILDDVVYDPETFPVERELHVPSEQLFMGLLEGRDAILVCAWPKGNQNIKMLLEPAEAGRPRIRGIQLALDAKSAYLTVLRAPRIWHKQKLLASYMEKDVEIGWERPFSAKWKTHLFERGELETAYAFKNGRSAFWRAGLGSMTYPVWFEGDSAFFHLSKRLPPMGQVLIYSLEGHKDTPIAFATSRLGDVPSLRKKSQLQRPDSVTGMAPCDGHDYMTRIFRVGLQTREKDFLREGLDDLMGVTGVYAKRLLQYHAFLERMNAKLYSWEQRADPELRPFLDEMSRHLRKLNDAYRQRVGDMTAPEHLRHQTEVIATLKTLVEEEGLEIYPQAAFLIEENHRFISLFEGVPANVGGQAREWARQAAYACAGNAAAVKYAEEIRRDICEFLGSGAKFESIY